MTGPATLDRDGIAARIPHRGRMCLLDRLDHWSPTEVSCRAVGHRDADHPLRTASGLLVPAAVEYAAQAMALHGALVAPAGAPPTPGYLASVRELRTWVDRLDEVDGALQVFAERLAGDASLVSYRFRVCRDDGSPLAEGRATVVLNAAPEAGA